MKLSSIKSKINKIMKENEISEVKEFKNKIGGGRRTNGYSFSYDILTINGNRTKVNYITYKGYTDNNIMINKIYNILKVKCEKDIMFYDEDKKRIYLNCED